MKNWLAAMLLLLGASAAVAAPSNWKEGVHYKVVNPAGKTTQPTVTEVFSYGCPACWKIDPMIDSWLKTKPATIKFERIPAYGFNPQWDVFAKVYYIAEALKLGEKAHAAIFEQIHVKNKRNWVDSDIVEFFKTYGKDEKAVRAAISGFYVDSKIRAAGAAVKKYKISGVPGFIVNGKYFTDGKMGGAQLFDILNDLAQMP